MHPTREHIHVVQNVSVLSRPRSIRGIETVGGSCSLRPQGSCPLPTSYGVWGSSVSSVYTRLPRFLKCVTSGDVGSGVAECDPQSYWNRRKNSGSFVDARSSESYQVRPFSITLSLIAFPLTPKPKHVTQNGHFALNSELRRYVWSSEAWLSKLGYS